MEKRTLSMKVNSMVKWMLPFYLFTFLPLSAQVGTWRAYMAYSDVQQIVKGGNLLYVRASNDLYSYNLNDQSITTYDKVNSLSDTYINKIAWNPTTSRLLIVYQNSNIDLMDAKDNITNISALYSRSMTQDKTVYCLCIHDVYAFLGTGFGVVKVNMERGEISETYYLGQRVRGVGVKDGKLYVRLYDRTVIAGDLNANLIDNNNWSSASVSSSIFNEDLTDWNEYLETVQTLQPGGPKYNYFGFMRFKNNRLYSCGGGYSSTYELLRAGTIQILQDGEWSHLQDNLEEVTGWRYRDVLAIDVDPADPEHVFAGGQTGVYEFQNGELVTAHNINNSPIQSALDNSERWAIIEGLCYDHAGNVWCLNSQVVSESLLEFTKDREWVSHHKQELMIGKTSDHGAQSHGALSGIMEDSRGYLWFVNNHWEVPSVYCYNPETDAFMNIFTTLINQDGTPTSVYYPRCVLEDPEGNIWIGTSEGPFVVEKNNIGVDNATVTQIKVPRNDDTNYADYLLSGANITCMAIDGGGRKWFGTLGSGVYLISADNMTQLANFTTSNSNLLSDNIESIAINNKTGEVFIGTDCGLCSYMSDATETSTEMTKDDVYAYPNPVTPDFTGLITVVGLTLDADVKVVSPSGKLIAQGRSNGGSFTWDGRDRNGHRVASGVYMVMTATADGKKGTVCKIAIVN